MRVQIEKVLIRTVLFFKTLKTPTPPLPRSARPPLLPWRIEKPKSLKSKMPAKIPKMPFPSMLQLASINARRFSSSPSVATETRTQKLERIADELLDLTKLERYDYSILFRLKMGLNRYGPSVTLDSSPSSSAVGSSAAAGAESKAEKTVFDIKLEKFDAAAKIKVIKEVRTFTDLGLKEAKDLVEKAPVVVKKGVTKEEASPIVEKLKVLGATVVLE